MRFESLDDDPDVTDRGYGRRQDRDDHPQIVAYSLVGDPYLSEDVLQDAYLKVLYNIESLREPSAFVNWFSQIVVLQCHRIFRQKRIRSLLLH